MKKNLLLLTFTLLAGQGFAQNTDSLSVARELDSLIQVSRTLTGKQDFDKALEVNAVAEKITLEKLGRESAMYGSACFNHGRVLYFKHDYPEAEKWYLESKEIREKVLGKESPDYAWSLNNLANLYRDMGDLEKSALLYMEVIKIREKVLGKLDLDYAASLNSLGSVYTILGNYEEAEPLLLEAKNIREKKLGKENASYAASLNNLSALYISIGDFETAEPLLFETKTIWEKTVGKQHQNYAICLANLASLNDKMGNYQKAEALYLEAKDIHEKNLGKDNLIYAADVNNLAILYYRIGNFEKAELLYLESKTIQEKVQGKGDPLYAQTLNNLAALYLDRKDYEKAEILASEAKTVQENLMRTQYPDYARSLNCLADLYTRTGKYEKAEPLYLEGRAIRETVLGKQHIEYLESLNSLTSFYWSIGNYNATSTYLIELAETEKKLLLKASRYLSEQELSSNIAKLTFGLNQTYAFAKIQKNISPLCYDNTLFYKGFLLNAASQVSKLTLTDTASTVKYYLLKSYHRRLAVEYAKPIAERKDVAELEEKANTLEKELTRTVAGFGEAIRQVNWQEVQATLQPTEAAIEFVHYKFSNPYPTDSTMYAALILRPDGQAPQFIPLFEKNELKELMRDASGGSNFLKINALYSQKSLYDLIWKPLEPMLTGIKTVYCAPSGLLHRLNLAAISTPEGKVYGERRQLVVLGSTRQLVVPNSNQTSTHDAYLAGGIRYENDSSAVAYANRSTSSRSIEPSVLAFQPDSVSITRGGVLDYLPATAEEVREIGQTLRSASIETKIDTGFYATEESFRQLGVGKPSPRIIHLATHGYFFPDPGSNGQKAKGNFAAEPVFKISDHPMIRSGLIMAGAKQAWLTGKHPEGMEDGILTAYEISQMNLSNTELVVLSACETGLGDIVGNEGVYGLQRAFKIAGAKYLIMSLWKVDDKSTRAFMTSFYRHWLTEKQTVPEAFRSTQREMRAKYAGAYDWAGFVLIE